MTNQSGTYFRDTYLTLVKQLPEFPAGDPSPNLQECIREEDERLNFVRAEMLARQFNLPSDTITRLREMAILQYVIDFKNGPALQKLIEDFSLSPAEVERIFELIKQEKEYPCFSFSRNTEMAIKLNWAETWKENFQPIIQQVVKPQLSVLSRFIGWIKRLFGGKST